MAEIRQFVCDNCRAIKGEINHWYLAQQNNSGFHVFPWGFGNPEIPTLHLCGQECVIAKVSEFMGAK